MMTLRDRPLTSTAHRTLANQNVKTQRNDCKSKQMLKLILSKESKKSRNPESKPTGPYSILPFNTASLQNDPLPNPVKTLEYASLAKRKTSRNGFQQYQTIMNKRPQS